MSEIDLTKLADPFPLEDIEWRVSRSGRGGNGIFCMTLAYITARAIQKRLDDVCGPENWRNEEPRMLDVNGKTAFAVGISIRIGEEWVTKWDVADPTNIEPAKGGFSGAMKRAGAHWGIGRYLYYLDETFAEAFQADDVFFLVQRVPEESPDCLKNDILFITFGKAPAGPIPKKIFRRQRTFAQGRG